MERSRLEFVMPTPPAVAPKLDDGGSGGDIGKNIHNGGGGGDGDGGDDDDYFNEEGDGDGEGDGQGGDAFFRTIIPESYDKLSIGAVFSEWMRTVAELPLILRRAVEMGLFSSAQLVRFFSMDVRPNLTRSVSRSLPPAVRRHGHVTGGDAVGVGHARRTEVQEFHFFIRRTNSWPAQNAFLDVPSWTAPNGQKCCISPFPISLPFAPR